MIAFVCPKCGQKLPVKDEVAGKRAKCPHCAAVLTIPAAPAPVPTMATGSRLRPARGQGPTLPPRTAVRRR